MSFFVSASSVLKKIALFPKEFFTFISKNYFDAFCQGTEAGLPVIPILGFLGFGILKVSIKD